MSQKKHLSNWIGYDKNPEESPSEDVPTEAAENLSLTSDRTADTRPRELRIEIRKSERASRFKEK